MDHEKNVAAAHDETHNTGIDSQLGHLANAEDHDVGKFGAIKRNPLAFAWCLYSVWVVLLVSFENQASGTVLGIPEFRKDFGKYYNGNYVINDVWQGAITGVPSAMAIFGTLLGAQFADWFGRRALFMLCLVLSFAAITCEFVATDIQTFFGGKLINGFATGALASVCTTYVGEITPLALRGVLTCCVALAYTLGPFTVALIVNSTGNQPTRWAYRAIFCSQYGFATVASLLVWFMPESPWWLCSKGRDEQALRSLQRLGYKNGEDAKRLAVVKLTLEQIRKETEGASFVECFRSSNLRRTIISLMPLAIQAMSGIVFAASYSTYYMELSGYSTQAAFKLQIVQQVLSMIGNACSWYLTDKVGRRSLTFWGISVLTVVLFVLGGLAVDGSPKALKGAVSMILIYCFLYNLTIGATAYNILAETSTSRLRVKTISLGLAFQYSLFVMWSFVLPKLFNPDQANLGGKTGFIFGAFSLLAIVYVYFYQTETAGRSYEEIDEMFMKRIPARQFKAYRTEAEQTGETVRRESIASLQAENLK